MGVSRGRSQKCAEGRNSNFPLWEKLPRLVPMQHKPLVAERLLVGGAYFRRERLGRQGRKRLSGRGPWRKFARLVLVRCHGDHGLHRERQFHRRVSVFRDLRAARICQQFDDRKQPLLAVRRKVSVNIYQV